MKRWSLIFGIVTMSVAISGQALASFEIIRWSSGYCEVRDQSSPFKPFGSDYKKGRKAFKSFDEATAARAKLIALRQCS